MMILLSATAENLAGNSVKSALTRIFPVPSFPHMDHGREFLSCRKMLTSLRILVAGAGSNRRPWGYESPTRQKLKSLPFLKLQPPRNFRPFYIPSHSLQFLIPYKLFILDTNWPQPSRVNPSVEQVST